MIYYKTLSGQPVKTNNPSSDMVPILERVEGMSNFEYIKLCEKEYKRICKQMRNDQIHNQQNQIETIETTR
jgi:hypothetical protein